MNITQDISFISEQEGETENEFKARIKSMLIKHNQPIRAYLTKVSYTKSGSDASIAICYKTNGDIKDEFVLLNTINIFKSMFGKHEHLDILFLNQTQENILRKIACPFYTAKNFQVSIPDFYLISSEGYQLNHPIACFKNQKLFGSHPDGYMLCDIQPDLISQNYGINSENICQVILANRHEGYSLFPISSWPAYAHVAIPLIQNIEEMDNINDSLIKLIAWGELYSEKPESM